MTNAHVVAGETAAAAIRLELTAVTTSVTVNATEPTVATTADAVIGPTPGIWVIVLPDTTP